MLGALRAQDIRAIQLLAGAIGGLAKSNDGFLAGEKQLIAGAVRNVTDFGSRLALILFEAHRQRAEGRCDLFALRGRGLLQCVCRDGGMLRNGLGGWFASAVNDCK